MNWLEFFAKIGDIESLLEDLIADCLEEGSEDMRDYAESLQKMSDNLSCFLPQYAFDETDKESQPKRKVQ